MDYAATELRILAHMRSLSMPCDASCDTCPADAWHLHVTVSPHRTWTHAHLVDALRIDIIEQPDTKLVRVSNMFHDARPSYVELIPTMNHKGTEAEATYALFKMAHFLSNKGWRVRRMKIEGDAYKVPVGRALYYETHITAKLDFEPLIKRLRLPLSVTGSGKRIVTLRHPAMGEIYRRALEINRAPTIVEAAVLDTNPDLDKEWLAQ